jgi:hypothetical protein
MLPIQDEKLGKCWKNWVLMRFLRLVKSQQLPTTLHLGCCAFPKPKRIENISVQQRWIFVEKREHFSLDKLETALMSLKSGKAAGFDGINPEFIKNFGVLTKEWIISFMKDIVSTSKIPNLFKRAKVISIIKTGKGGISVQYRFLT